MKVLGEEALQQLIRLIKMNGGSGESVTADTIWYGDSSPSEPSKYQFWFDSDSNLKVRKESEEGYVYETISLGNSSATGGDAILTINYRGSSNVILQKDDIEHMGAAICSYKYVCKDNSGDRIGATAVWKKGNVIIATERINQNNEAEDSENENQQFDVTQYLSLGENQITLNIKDDIGRTATKTWAFTVVDLSVKLSNSLAYAECGKQIPVVYTPYGSVSKNIHFKIDNDDSQDEFVSTLTSGSDETHYIKSRPHGAYFLECYAEAVIGGNTVKSNSVSQSLIWYDKTNTTPIIACNYDKTKVGTASIKQYDVLNIKYDVFEANEDGEVKTSHNVNIVIDGTLYETTLENELNSTIANGLYQFKTKDVGTHNIAISCGSVSVQVQVEVESLGYNIEISQKDNVAFEFDPTDIIDNSWISKEDSSIRMIPSHNFDWYNGGIKTDEEGTPYLLVKANTNVTFTYNLFNSTIPVTGTEFKIIFQTENASNPDATFLTCSEKGVAAGLEMRLHEAYISSNKEYFSTPYCEEEKIEWDLNITNNADKITMMTGYEDGVPTQGCPTDSSSKFVADAPIVIGSSDCDVRIYKIRAYKNSIGDRGVLDNYIADAPTSEEIVKRYQRNQILKDGKLDPWYLAEKCPDLRVVIIEAPKFTTGKKSFIKDTTVTYMYKNGDPVKDNWIAKNCYHAGQGTTSDTYGDAGRNIDIIMCLDGKTDINSKVTLDPNYKTVITLGDGVTTTDKVALSTTSVPNNWFNIKVNIASSENTNNAVLQKRFDRYLSYDSIARLINPKVKNSMEFFNCVVFIRETDENLNEHNEFMDNELHFYAIGNIGDSKKTDSTRANDVNDTREFTIEVTENTYSNSTFQTGVCNMPIIYTGSEIKQDDVISHISSKLRYDSQDIFTLSKDDVDNESRVPIIDKIQNVINNPGVLFLSPINNSPTCNEYYIYMYIRSSFVRVGQTSSFYQLGYKNLDIMTYRFIHNKEEWDNENKIPINIKNPNEKLLYLKTIDTGGSYCREYIYNQITKEFEYICDGIINLDEAGESVIPAPLELWNHPRNLKRISLRGTPSSNGSNDSFNVSKASFEFRYEMGGNTKDGEIILTDDEKDAQRKLNKELWFDFCEWVSTCSDNEFVNGLAGWTIPDSMYYWYLFTERFTMMDNRAKNTFWHFGKIGTMTAVSTLERGIYYEVKNGIKVPTNDFVATNGKTYYEFNYTFNKVPYPSKSFMDMYYEETTEPDVYDKKIHFKHRTKNGFKWFIKTRDTYVKEDKAYYWFYGFDMWDYDNDSALGINNSGALTVPPYKEDYDRYSDGAMYFNGAKNAFWCRLRNLFSSELANYYRTRDNFKDGGCFSSTSVINEFENWQNQFPEMLWVYDVERKIYRSYFGVSIDNSKKRDPNKMFLGGDDTFMNGRKIYQRKYWDAEQRTYLNTKYVAPEAKNYSVIFRTAASNQYYYITPYTDMYLVVETGNENTEVATTTIRAVKGQSYKFQVPELKDNSDTMITIYQGDKIARLDNLAACALTILNLSKAKRITELVLGSKEKGYINTYLKNFDFDGLKVLKKVNLEGYPNMTLSNLSKCTTLEVLEYNYDPLTREEYAQNRVPTDRVVEFAKQGMIREVVLPPDIKSITLSGLEHLYNENLNIGNNSGIFNELTSFVDDGSVSFDDVAFLESLYNYTKFKNFTHFECLNIDWNLDNAELLNRLEILKRKDNTCNLTGVAHVDEITSIELESLNNTFKELIINPAKVIPYATIRYYGVDPNTPAYVKTAPSGVDSSGNYYRMPLNPLNTNEIPSDALERLQKPDDDKYEYTLVGWEEPHTGHLLGDMSFHATYSEKRRVYTVKFYKRRNTSPLDTITVLSYEAANFTKDESEITDDYGIYLGGWLDSKGNNASSLLNCVKSDLNVYANMCEASTPDFNRKNEGFKYLYSNDPSDAANRAYELGEFYWIIKNRKGEEYFNIGDKIRIKNSNVDVVMQLADFDHYQDANATVGIRDDEGNDITDPNKVMLHTTWVTERIYTTMGMTESNDDTEARYAKGIIVPYLSNLFTLFPKEYKEIIKKSYFETRSLFHGTLGYDWSTVRHNSNLFLFCSGDIGVKYGYSFVSPYAKHNTMPLFSTNASRQKGGAWWLRSAGNDGNLFNREHDYFFTVINTDGSEFKCKQSATPYGVVFGCSM